MADTMTKERNNYVKSVFKAFAIMEELDRSGFLGIAEIANRLAMDRATVFRLVSTLKEAGYVTQNPENKKYANGLKLFSMGNRVIDNIGIRQLARPYMEELALKSGETANLGMPMDTHVVFVDKIESKETIKAGLTIGAKVPIYCTGMGRAMLAFMPEDQQKKTVESIHYTKYTKYTVDSDEQLMKQLREIKARGYCFDDEEYVENLICFGAPVFDYHGIPVAAISISGPKYRFAAGEQMSLFVDLVVSAGASISAQLGYQGITIGKV